MHGLLVAEWVVRLVMFAVVVARKRSVPTALAWLAVIAFVPFVGAVAYFLLGEIRLGRNRSARYHDLVGALAESAALRAQFTRHPAPPLRGAVRRIADLAQAVGAGEPRSGNRVELHDDAAILFERLAGDIHSARHHCHLEFYIADDDDVSRMVVDALLRARRRGVACRVLLDAAGSRAFLKGPLTRRLREAGVDVVAMLPVSALRAAVARLDVRNHRKLCVIDGRAGYVGSHNLTDPIYPGKEAFGDWMDASVRVEGPLVYDLQEVFLHDWAFNTGAPPADEHFFPPVRHHEGGAVLSLLPTAPTVDRAPLLDVIVQTLQLADERCVLTTPYFVPDDAVLAALRSAALRGVEVVLVVPKHGDHPVTQAAGRSHYGYLMDVGVQIREYPGALLHAKTLTMDRRFGMVGSANLDVRSFLLNFELALLIHDDDLASQLHYLQAEYLERAEVLTPARWRGRGVIRRAGDSLAKLVTPIL
ncbi:MAG TPA: cardiolipin synthase [Longimicrobiales bacterium]|nr:cardiolipin synthase [Longimicrobiales bacterium]